MTSLGLTLHPLTADDRRRWRRRRVDQFVGRVSNTMDTAALAAVA